MKFLLAADIFGDTPQLRGLGQDLQADFVVISPYDQQRHPFSSEADAYATFTACGGIAAYAAKLGRAISSHQPGALVGFSVGASAAWLALAKPAAPQLQAAVLFYGSRIREHRQLRPNCPTTLIFAEQEKSFEPQQLAASLQAADLEIIICPGSRHGFMNPLSPGYQAAGQALGIELIRAALAKAGPAGEENI